MREALPLASKPHLLNPTARRDQLFGSTRSSNDELQIDIPQCIDYGTHTGKMPFNISSTIDEFYISIFVSSFCICLSRKARHIFWCTNQLEIRSWNIENISEFHPWKMADVLGVIWPVIPWRCRYRTAFGTQWNKPVWCKRSEIS